MRDVNVGPLPRRLLAWTEAGGELLPAWLTERDWPWLRDLLALARQRAGLPLRELVRSWQQDGGDPRAGPRLPMAREVLLRLLRARASRPVLPALVRQYVFAAAAAGAAPAAAWRAAAARLGRPVAEVAALLFADLPGERPVAWPQEAPHPPGLALLVNRALAQGLLCTASSATLALHGAARAVLRTAWLHGSGLEAEDRPGAAVRLHWQAGAAGTARCRQRALAAILPVLPWCRTYELRAVCRPAGRSGLLVLGTGDPILPGPEPRPFDSALERRFGEQFARIAAHWALVREPAPVVVGRAMVFPDFELHRRTDGARWWLEIAGLRRPEALACKLDLLARLPQLLLCLPRHRTPAEAARHPRVITFTRAVDAAIVLQRLEAACGA